MNIKAKAFIRMAFASLLLLGAYGVAATIAMKPGDACAAATPATPCDPEYMDALEARAWLEAQREVSQNQNFILKPDSVLEYTCFDSFLREIGDHAEHMFSETTRWGAITDLDNQSQDRALAELIHSGLVDYLTNNFNHTFLSGRATTDYTPGSPMASGGETYSCEMLRRVWEEAKCMNFIDEASIDGFYDFRWYQSNDPRTMPTTMAACTSPATAPYTFATMEGIAFNARQDMYVLTGTEAPPTPATGYNRDNLVTFLNFILPRGVAPATACTTPIRTGVTVNRRGGGGAYPDGVCSNPGCYLSADGTACN